MARLRLNIYPLRNILGNEMFDVFGGGLDQYDGNQLLGLNNALEVISSLGQRPYEINITSSDVTSDVNEALSKAKVDFAFYPDIRENIQILTTALNCIPLNKYITHTMFKMDNPINESLEIKVSDLKTSINLESQVTVNYWILNVVLSPERLYFAVPTRPPQYYDYFDPPDNNKRIQVLVKNYLTSKSSGSVGQAQFLEGVYHINSEVQAEIDDIIENWDSKPIDNDVWLREAGGISNIVSKILKVSDKPETYSPSLKMYTNSQNINFTSEFIPRAIVNKLNNTSNASEMFGFVIYDKDRVSESDIAFTSSYNYSGQTYSAKVLNTENVEEWGLIRSFPYNYNRGVMQWLGEKTILPYNLFPKAARAKGVPTGSYPFMNLAKS